MNVKQLQIFALTALFGLSACSANPQPTLEELMTEVNTAHQAVDKDDIDLSPYSEKLDQDRSILYYYNYKVEGDYDPQKVLTREQAEEDVTFLFDAFHDCYGLYGYLGGEEIFDVVEKKIQKELKTRESLSAQDLEQLVLENLSFLRDGHFSINQKQTNPLKMPYFFREVAFVKTEEGYRTVDGKKVRAIDGYELNEIMKRSISPEGELVYYPVLLKDHDYWAVMEEAQPCGESLTVHYTNGESQQLTAEDYQIYVGMDREQPEIWEPHSSRQQGEIPVFQINTIQGDWKQTDELLAGADPLKGASVSILDLRTSPGGSGSLIDAWIKTYAGEKVNGNFSTVAPYQGKSTSGGVDCWIENENILIVLTGKVTASAAEMLVDYAHNLENVLFVGENTMGACLRPSYNIYLPNSVCRVNIGFEYLYVFPEGDYFEELRGFYPDVWVPAAEAEELAVKLMERLYK